MKEKEQDEKSRNREKHKSVMHVTEEDLLARLDRAVAAALWGAVVPVEQETGNGEANEGASDG